MTSSLDTASYCCDLLGTVGPCVAKRMFGGFSISTGGLTLAILADLGDGEKLWLKGDDATRSQYTAAGCAIFTYHPKKGVPRSMNYFCAPDDAMDSPDAMRPLAALALACAVRASLGKRAVATKSVSKKSTSLSVPTTPVPTTATPSQTLAKASGPHTGQLSQAVLERARDVAKKIAVSSTLPKVNAAKPSTKRTAALPPNTAAPRKSAKGASTASQ
jgi:DNA transformation protein and related proteins